MKDNMKRVAWITGLMFIWLLAMTGAVFASTGVNVSEHSQDDIRSYVNSLGITYDTPVFATTPKISKETYDVGDEGLLSEATMTEGLKMLKAIRYIAGLSDDVTLDGSFNQLAQAVAFTNAINKTMAHEPARPTGMSDSLFNLATQGGKSSNLGWSQSNYGYVEPLAEMTLGWMSDEDASNVDVVGHRRWMINPKLQKVGFGYCNADDGNNHFYAIRVFDTSGSGGQTGVVWPAQNMPVDYFEDNYPWSYSLGSAVSNDTNVSLTLKRQGQVVKTWSFTQQSTNTSGQGYYYKINNGNYGQQGCVIFRPDDITYHAGDHFDVTISGSSVNASYSVDFFSLKPVTSFTIPEKVSVAKGKTTTIRKEILPKDASDQSPIWVSADSTIATVDQTGKVTGVGEIGQKTTITAYLDGKTATCEVVIGIDISEAEVKVLKSDYAGTYGSDAYYVYYYTGKPIVPELKVSLNGQELVKDKDYEIIFQNPSDHTNGDNTLKRFFVEGCGQYAGTVITPNKYIVIWPRHLYDDKISITIEPHTYTGIEITPTISVIYDKGGDSERILEPDKDYQITTLKNNMNVGQATVTITGQGNYDQSKTAKFQIVPKDISEAVLGQIDHTQIYSGTEKTQENLTVTLPGYAPVAGTDYEVSYQNNINAAAATDEKAPKVIVTGKGNYTGSAEACFTILPFELTKDHVTLNQDTYTYTGQKIIPSVTVQVNTTTLEQDKDYVVSSVNSVDVPAEDATELPVATVTGEGNYCGTVSCGFNIEPAALSLVAIGDIPEQIYSGVLIEPELQLSFHETPLEKDKDYTVSFENNLNAALSEADHAPTVTIQGKGNFTGSEIKTFTISAKDLKDAVLKGLATKTYTGSEIVQEALTVEDAGIVLNPETDYEVSYSNNINARGAGETNAPTVIVTGKGNYCGNRTEAFAIEAMAIAEDDVTLTSLTFTYTGEPIVPEVTVKAGGFTLVKDKDYSVACHGNTDVTPSSEPRQTYATITCGGNFSGTFTKPFTIVAADIADALFAEVGSPVYTGLEVEPAFELWFNEKKLVKDQDFTVVYRNHIAAATADSEQAPTIVVSGKGNFTGTKEEAFTIKQKPITDGVIGGIVEKTYDGSAQTQEALTVTLEGNLLDPTTDYVITYENHTDAGDATSAKAPTVIATGTGNYCGSTRKTFTIIPCIFGDEAVTLAQDTYTYSGVAIIPTLSVTVGDKLLTTGKDYEVTCSDHVNASANLPTYTVTGKGNYAGNVQGHFTIVPADLSAATVSAIPEQTCTGSEIKPALTVKVGTRTLTAGTDYDTQYENNVQVGNAIVTITGKGNYTGSTTAGFVIKEKKDEPSGNNENGNQGSNGAGDQGTGQGSNQGSSQTTDGTGTQGTNQDSTRTSATEGTYPLDSVNNMLISTSGDKDLSISTYETLQAAEKKVTNNAVTLSWKGTPGAVKYLVYGNMRGQRNTLLQEVHGTSWTQTNLKKGKYYKYSVVAVNGSDEVLAVSRNIIACTNGGKTTNVKKVSIAGKKTLKLKKGKKASIKAKLTLEKAGLKNKTYRKLSFESSDPSVATVNAKGKVKAVGKGTCRIYVYTQNGKSAVLKVKVS